MISNCWYQHLLILSRSWAVWCDSLLTPLMPLLHPLPSHTPWHLHTTGFGAVHRLGKSCEGVIPLTPLHPSTNPFSKCMPMDPRGGGRKGRSTLDKRYLNFSFSTSPPLTKAIGPQYQTWGEGGHSCGDSGSGSCGRGWQLWEGMAAVGVWTWCQFFYHVCNVLCPTWILSLFPTFFHIERTTRKWGTQWVRCISTVESVTLALQYIVWCSV